MISDQNRMRSQNSSKKQGKRIPHSPYLSPGTTASTLPTVVATAVTSHDHGIPLHNVWLQFILNLTVFSSLPLLSNTSTRQSPAAPFMISFLL